MVDVTNLKNRVVTGREDVVSNAFRKKYSDWYKRTAKFENIYQLIQTDYVDVSKYPGHVLRRLRAERGVGKVKRRGGAVR